MQDKALIFSKAEVKKTAANKCRLPHVTKYIVLTVFVLYALTLVFPFVWSALNSMRVNKDFKRDPLDWFNFARWTLNNYNVALRGEYNMISMFGNSLFLSVVCTCTATVISAMSAYVVAKYRFRGKNIIYGLSITIMLIPTSGSLAALYRFMVDSALIDHYIGIILLNSGGFGFNFFLLYGTFKGVSWSYAEAAKIDGASNFKVFLKIMLPQVKSALVAVGIITFIGQWNDYFTPYMFLRNHPTIAVGIYRLQKSFETSGSNWPVVFAAMVLTTVPVIVIFAVFQKTIISNTVAGGLKG